MSVISTKGTPAASSRSVTRRDTPVSTSTRSVTTKALVNPREAISWGITLIAPGPK